MPALLVGIASAYRVPPAIATKTRCQPHAHTVAHASPHLPARRDSRVVIAGSEIGAHSDGRRDVHNERASQVGIGAEGAGGVVGLRGPLSMITQFARRGLTSDVPRRSTMPTAIMLMPAGTAASEQVTMARSVRGVGLLS